MQRFKACVKWMTEDLGCKTHILQPGGLKMCVMEKLPCQNWGVKLLRQIEALVFFRVQLMKSFAGKSCS